MAPSGCATQHCGASAVSVSTGDPGPLGNNRRRQRGEGRQHSSALDKAHFSEF